MKRPSFDRRAFLKLGTSSSLALLPSPSILRDGIFEGAISNADTGPTEFLPTIPALGDLASDQLVHQYRDLFTPPAAQNEWGYAQTWKSISALTSITIPPFSCCGVPRIDFSPGNLVTCEFFLNDRLLNSYSGTGAQVGYKWYPHCVVRQAYAVGLHMVTHTFMPTMQRAVAQKISVRNESSQRQAVKLGFDLRAGVTMNRERPSSVDAYAEADTRQSGPETGCG
jgi:hypothetical protein